MFDKILVPLDGSDLAASILPQVTELAKKLQAELTLIHVSPGEQDAIAVPPGSIAADVLQTCRAYLNMLGKDLQHQGLKVKVVCLRGNPAQEIIRYAEEHQIDFIAMATHGGGEVAWLLGSIARKVVAHASRPVMLFRVLEFEFPQLKGTVKPIKFT
jgi:nucleotide-binding universal stress UspA family protein